MNEADGTKRQMAVKHAIVHSQASHRRGQTDGEAKLGTDGFAGEDTPSLFSAVANVCSPRLPTRGDFARTPKAVGSFWYIHLQKMICVFFYKSATYR